MAGQLARAYLRTGKPVLDNIVNIFNDMAEKQRQRDALTNAMNLYKQFQGKIGDISNASTTQYQPTETQTSPNLFPDQPDAVSSLLNKSVGIQPKTDFNMLGKQVTTPLPQVEKYNQGQNAVGDFLMQLMSDPNSDKISPNKLSLLSSLVDRSAGMLKPDAYKYESEDPTKRQVRINTRTGVREVVDQGQPKRTLTQLKPNSETGTYWGIDGEGNPVDSKIPSTQELTPYQKASLLAIEKDNKQSTAEERTQQAQDLYNSLMDSWDDNAKAYVVTQPVTGKKLRFKDDRAIQSYAASQVAGLKAPGKINMWKHSTSDQAQNPSQKTTPENKFVEGKIYVDGNGNKAKYVNGQWEEIK